MRWRTWLAIGGAALAVLVVLGLVGQAINRSDDRAADETCRETDRRWERALLPAYEAVVDAGQRQRRAMATGTPTQRDSAQVARLEATMAFGDAAREVVPCSRDAARLRLLALEMGEGARGLLTIQEQIAAGDRREAVATAFFERADDLERTAEEFNRLVVDIVAPE